MDEALAAFLDYLLEKPNGRYKIIKDDNKFLVIMPDENGEESATEYIKRLPHG